MVRVAPFFDSRCRLIQLPTLREAGNEYRPKCDDALWMGNKGRYGSFHMWIIVWVAGANLSASEMSIACIINRYINVLFTYLLTFSFSESVGQ